MTPKQKAEELVNKYFSVAEDIEWTTNEETLVKAEKLNDDLGDDVLIYWHNLAKKSALIAVDLVLSEFYADDFYIEVKHEINQL
jgi:hypothetical protein